MANGMDVFADPYDIVTFDIPNEVDVTLIKRADGDYYVYSDFVFDFPPQCRRKIRRFVMKYIVTIDINVVKRRTYKVKPISRCLIKPEGVPMLVSTIRAHRHNCFACVDEEGTFKVKD